MKENNVLRPAFGKKMVEAEKPPPKAPERDTETDTGYYDPKDFSPEQLRRAQLDLIFMLQEVARIEKVRDKLHAIGDFIHSLKDYVLNKEHIKLRRQGMTSLSLEDLCTQAENSTEQQWTLHPAYFGALTLEYHYRVKAALSLMPADEKK